MGEEAGKLVGTFDGRVEGMLVGWVVVGKPVGLVDGTTVGILVGTVLGT